MKVPLVHTFTEFETLRAFGKTLSNAKKYEMFPFLCLVEEARNIIDKCQLNFQLVVTFSPKLDNKVFSIHPVKGV